MKRKAYCSTLWLLPLLALILAACGDNGQHLGIDGYFYTAQEIDLPGQAGSTTGFRIKNGYFYYRQEKTIYRFSVEDFPRKQGSTIPLEEGGIPTQEESAPLPEGMQLPQGEAVATATGGVLQDYTLDSNGGLCYITVDVSWRTGEALGGTLARTGQDGTEIYRLDLENIDTPNVSLAMDGRNRIFLLAGDSLYLVGETGELLAEIPGGSLKAEFYRDSGRLLEGEDGRVYYSPGDYYNAVYEITGDDEAFRQGTFRMERIELPGTCKCYSSSFGLLCGDAGLLYRYRKADSRWEPLLRYGDSNLPSRPAEILELTEDRLIVSYSYPYDTLYLLDRAKAELLPEREVLVLATRNLSRELEAYIMDFNRADSRYHIRVEFCDDVQMDVRMNSSSPPDLVDMDDEMVLKYAGKGALEDLGAWLEGSGQLDREDFLENVVNGYTIEGRLVCIPDSFLCRTALGRAGQLGEKAGWTAHEAMELAERYPETQLFRNPTFTSMVSFFQQYICERFIDWDSGECSFGGEAFRELVRWMEGHSKGMGNGMAGSTYDSLVSVDMPVTEEELLVLEAYIDGLSGLVLYELRMGEDITAVGYPTADGRAYYPADKYNTLGIPADSRNKEAAWQFLEGFLSREDNERTRRSGLPARRDLLEEMEEALAGPEYERDERGDIIVWDSAGESGMAAQEWLYVEGESVPLYYLTGEQLEDIRNLIEAIDFTPQGGIRKEISGILLEELAPYLDGKKSLEEALRIIQNRVGNLVRE